MHSHKVFLALIISAVSSLFALAFYVYAASIYPATTTGHDISFPNCSQNYQSLTNFGIVGVTGGRAFSTNPCLDSQYNWAVSSSPTTASLYMNTNAPIGTTGNKGLNGPLGQCQKKDKACQAFNYGYNAAQDAHNYAVSQGATNPAMWWLDIETSNSWSMNKTHNQYIIDGASAFFQGGNYRGVNPTIPVAPGVPAPVPVGAYSTASQWQTITNGYHPAYSLPAWIATLETNSSATATHCLTQDFTGQSTYLVQYIDGSGFDANYACP